MWATTNTLLHYTLLLKGVRTMSKRKLDQLIKKAWKRTLEVFDDIALGILSEPPQEVIMVHHVPNYCSSCGQAMQHIKNNFAGGFDVCINRDCTDCPPF
jgi:hypothetical protein